MNLLFPGITIFGFTVTYYAICIVSGMVIATLLSALMMKRRNVSPELVITFFIVCIPSAIIGARLFYCITDAMPIDQWFSWESIRRGGLSILGGVIGGVGAGLIVCLVKKLEFFRAADCVVITILLAQAIGRWGNFFNGEVYGAEITDPAWQWFPVAVEVNGAYYQALFFYEGCINTLGFILLYTAAWFFDRKPNGIFTFAYFVWYGTVRAIMEPMRNPQFILGEDAMWSQVFAIGMIVFGLLGIAVLLLINYKKEGAVIGSKRGDPCGITPYLAAGKDDQPYFSKINRMGANYPPRPPKPAKGTDGSVAQTASDGAGQNDSSGDPAEGQTAATQDGASGEKQEIAEEADRTGGEPETAGDAQAESDGGCSDGDR